MPPVLTAGIAAESPPTVASGVGASVQPAAKINRIETIELIRRTLAIIFSPEWKLVLGSPALLTADPNAKSGSLN